jgi:hypothetical protein
MTAMAEEYQPSLLKTHPKGKQYIKRVRNQMSSSNHHIGRKITGGKMTISDPTGFRSGDAMSKQ